MRFIAALTLTLFTLFAAPLQSADWSRVADLLEQSVLFVATSASTCTGSVINESRNLVLTAAHCDGTNVLVDQRPAKTIAKDARKDLLVLEVKDLDHPALKLAADDPKRGDQVSSFGFGYGLERPLLRLTYVSDDRTYIDSIGGPWIVTDATFAAGQSGGPLVNGVGDIVGIVLRGTSETGLALGAREIRSKVGRYFEKDPK